MEVGSHVVTLGGVAVPRPPDLPVPLNDTADRSEVRVLDRSVEPEIVRRIDEAKQAGDTLGGEVEVVARGVVVGLGSHVSWDRKLDGRLAWPSCWKSFVFFSTTSPCVRADTCRSTGGSRGCSCPYPP